MKNAKLYVATPILLFALEFYLMPKTIQLLLVQSQMHSYTCAASTVKDLKHILFLKISAQSYLGTTEISKTSQLKNIFKLKSANNSGCSCNYLSSDVFFSSHPHIRHQNQNNEQQWTCDHSD